MASLHEAVSCQVHDGALSFLCLLHSHNLVMELAEAAPASVSFQVSEFRFGRLDTAGRTMLRRGPTFQDQVYDHEQWQLHVKNRRHCPGPLAW